MRTQAAPFVLALLALAVASCATAAPPPARDVGIPIDAAPAMDVPATVDAGAPIDGDVVDGGVDAAMPPDGGGTPRCTAATAAAICGSLPCVDGYCCDQPCGGLCRSCAVPGWEGVCRPWAAGEDPDGECATDPSVCGRTSFCDGMSGCAMRGSETTCDDAADCTTGDVCDGAGTCRGMAPSSCGPGVGNECCLGSCAAGVGCTTVASTCADSCTTDTLTTGETCGGCGAAGAVGTCGGGATHSCTAASHVACDARTCGGATYYCTNDGGTWGWRTAARCDDGMTCTYNDVCGTSGTCTGTAVTCTSSTCATRACNGTATCTVTPNAGATCDDANACTYGDVCDASGGCAGTSITCTSSPCTTRTCNGTASCAVTPRTGACDDGMACTYGDTCDSGGTCTGTTINCSAMSTTCRGYTCNGTSTCATMAINLGGSCSDGDPLTMGDTCRSDGNCLGSTGCPPPAAACATGAESRSGCGNARVIGRTPAGAAGGTRVSGSTCSGSNSFGAACGGAAGGGNDHAYRIYMLTGERIDIEARTSSPCGGTDYNGVFRILENTGCTSTACTTQVSCRAAFSFHSASYTAPRDGWVILVMDGQTISGTPQNGSYTLDVDLTCAASGCGC